MKILKQVLNGACVLSPSVFNDDRGYFFESYNQKIFNHLAGDSLNFVQDNQSLSSRGTLRGMHFQTGEFAQAKLVRVVRGAVYDVAVDLRHESPTFKKWYGIELNEENRLQFYIPRGFAHGFVTLTDDTIFQYKVDNYYSKVHEGGIAYNDEEIGITWPLSDVVLSGKDSELPSFGEWLDSRDRVA